MQFAKYNHYFTIDERKEVIAIFYVILIKQITSDKVDAFLLYIDD